MVNQSTSLLLFGASKSWNADDWTASDDRVRGGKSQSYLEISESVALFRGVLDIKTLGGAGFASQRTTGDDRLWDLSAYDGIELSIDPSKSDSKKFTFILKDEILPKNPDNDREQATISWEYDFKVSSPEDAQRGEDTLSKVLIPWKLFKPTYRGKEKPDARGLDLMNIKRLSIMMRSFFGTQEGKFCLTLKTISAFTNSASTLKLETKSVPAILRSRQPTT